MASLTKETRIKRQRRHRNAGKQRKHRQGKRSTPSEGELFAGCGEPGKPAPSRS